MKPKIFKGVSNNDYPYEIFSSEINSPIYKTPFYNYQTSIKNKSKHKRNTPIRPFTTKERHLSTVSKISKSLKSVILSSNLYSNYIDLYKQLTQDTSFKTPKVTQYPILKNEKYLPIKTEPSIKKETNKEKISFTKLKDESNDSLFISAVKNIKTVKKIDREKIYNMKYPNHKSQYERAKSAISQKAAKDFRELCDHNIFETKFLDQIGIKKIDIYNCSEEKQKNFKFFEEYIKRLEEIQDIFNENNFHRNITFNGKTAIRKEKMEFNLDINSLCFKFYSLSENNNNINSNVKKKECQRLFFPFELMPIFYLLDFESFKVFLSEIITYNQYDNCFEYIREGLFLKKLKKYINYISNFLEDKTTMYINDIIYNKNESLFPLSYDWIVADNIQSEEDEEIITKNDINKLNDNYQCFKLKIVLPKIKFGINNISTKIVKLLNKHMIANLLEKNYQKWEKFVFFDLFSTKKFKILLNLIQLNKYNKISKKNILLYNKHNIQNKDYEFFLTQIGENYSFHYTFIPYTILTLYGDKHKTFQKIIMTLKESRNLNKFGQNWGMINTLFKCMFINTMKNKIFFNFNLLEDDKNELYNAIKSELNKEIRPKSSNFNKIVGKSTLKKNKDKEKEAIYTKYKDNIFEISLLKCSFLKINITSIRSEYKYYQIPSNILNKIFNVKDEKKLFDTNFADISLMAKYIGRNYKSILSAKEINVTVEEQSMMDKADTIEDLLKYGNKEIEIARNPNRKRLKTFQMFKNKDSKDLNNKFKKQFSNMYNFPRGLASSKNHKKENSLTNLNEADKNKVININRNLNKKRTFTMKYIK